MSRLKFFNYRMQAVYDYIATHDGFCSTKAIADATLLTEQAVRNAANKLERRGWITRDAQGRCSCTPLADVLN